MLLQDLRVGALALTLCWVAAPATAQVNLLTNGSFDTDVADWEPVEAFMSVAFDMQDVDDDEESGSAMVTFNPTLDTATSGHVAQCVQVRPGGTYTGSLSFLRPSGQNRVGSASMRVVWYESDDCSGPSPEFGFGISSSFEGDWADLAPFDFVAPDDINSADVEIEVLKLQLGGTLTIFYDDVMFVPEPSPALAGMVALLSSVGVARWTRRRGSRRPGTGARACECGSPPGSLRRRSSA